MFNYVECMRYVVDIRCVFRNNSQMKNTKRKIEYTPAEVVVKEFGSIREVGRVLGLQHTSPRLWLQPRPVGSGGLIPSCHLVPLLTEARKRGLSLCEHDLIWGR